MTYRSIHKGHVLGGAYFIAIPLAIFSSKAMAPLFIATVVFALGADFMREHRLPGLSRQWIVLFALIVAWGMLSTLWSMTPGRSLYLNLPLAGTYLGGLVLVALAGRLEANERSFFERALIAGAVLGFAVLAVEVFTPLALTSVIVPLFRGYDIAEYREWIYTVPAYSAPNFYKPGAMVAVILAWPAAAVLWRRGARRRVAFLAAAVILVLSMSHIETAIFGLIAGLAAFAAAWTFRRRAAWVFAALIVLGTAAAPMVQRIVPDTRELARIAPNLPEGVFPRIFIWRQVADLIAENPIIGKGLDTSRAISPNDDLILFTGKGGTILASERVPLHPHNAVLQVWLELGAVGAVLLAAVLLVVIHRLAVVEAGRVERALGFGGFVCTLSIVSVSHGIWQSWWQGTLWLTVAFTVGALSKPTGVADRAEE